jgi:hypothetical protein
MRAYKTSQIPRSETQYIQIFKIQRNLFYMYFENWVVSSLDYTILGSHIEIKYGLVNTMCLKWLLRSFDGK